MNLTTWIFRGGIGILHVNLGKLDVAHTLNGGHDDIVRGVSWNAQVCSPLLVAIRYASIDYYVCRRKQLFPEAKMVASVYGGMHRFAIAGPVAFPA